LGRESSRAPREGSHTRMKTVSLGARLEEISGIKVRTELPLARLTTFKIGGPVAVLVTPETVEGLQETMKVLLEAEAPLFILGNGSNLLVADEGFDGVVIRIGSALGAIASEGPDQIRIGAGALWSAVLRFIQKEGWTGLEFGAGIPGTLGGAISTNAGTRGGETFDALIGITGVDRSGEIRTLAKESIVHRYRSADLPDRFVVTETAFHVAREDPAKITERIRGYQAERRRDQPEREPSAGCIFKNPPGGSAGKLIDVAGMKGEREGAAVISPVHGNFIINEGGATAAQVLRLIERIRERVRKEYGVELELEVRKLGLE